MSRIILSLCIIPPPTIILPPGNGLMIYANCPCPIATKPKTLIFLYFMNENFNKNAKVEQLTNMILSRGEEKCFIVKDPLLLRWYRL